MLNTFLRAQAAPVHLEGAFQYATADEAECESLLNIGAKVITLILMNSGMVPNTQRRRNPLNPYTAFRKT